MIALDGTGGFHLGDLLIGVAVLVQVLGGVVADGLGQHHRGIAEVRVADRGGGQRALAEGLVVHLADSVVDVRLLVLDDVGVTEDLLAGHLPFGQDGQPLVERFLDESAFEDLDELRLQVLFLEVLNRGVLARLRVVGAELLRAHGDAAAPDGGVVQVDDDFVAPARAQLVHQRPQDAGGHHGRGVVIAERLGRNGRRRALLAEGTRDAAAGSPAHSVVAGGVCELAELAVAAHLSPDKTGELGGQRGVVEAQLLQGGRAHVVHEDVCFADHLLRDGQTFLGFQVEGDPVLVGVRELRRTCTSRPL